MKIEEMIRESLEHSHSPSGQISWHYVGEEEYRQFSRCVCGIALVRHTAPLGAGYNWEDWKISK